MSMRNLKLTDSDLTVCTYSHSVGLYPSSECILFKTTSFKKLVLLPSSGGR
jgi:hypothetical protein